MMSKELEERLSVFTGLVEDVLDEGPFVDIVVDGFFTTVMSPWLPFEYEEEFDELFYVDLKYRKTPQRLALPKELML